jgi:hypothetical protein
MDALSGRCRHRCGKLAPHVSAILGGVVGPILAEWLVTRALSSRHARSLPQPKAGRRLNASDWPLTRRRWSVSDASTRPRRRRASEADAFSVHATPPRRPRLDASTRRSGQAHGPAPPASCGRLQENLRNRRSVLVTHLLTEISTLYDHAAQGLSNSLAVIDEMGQSAGRLGMLPQ